MRRPRESLRESIPEKKPTEVFAIYCERLVFLRIII